MTDLKRILIAVLIYEGFGALLSLQHAYFEMNMWKTSLLKNWIKTFKFFNMIFIPFVILCIVGCVLLRRYYEI